MQTRAIAEMSGSSRRRRGDGAGGSTGRGDAIGELGRTAGNRAVAALLSSRDGAPTVQRDPVGDAGFGLLAGGPSDLGPPPIGHDNPISMGYSQVVTEIHALDRWQHKQTQSTVGDQAVDDRLSALHQQLKTLETPVSLPKVKGKQKVKLTAFVARPRSLTEDLDPLKMSKDDVAHELDLIVNYLARGPSKKEQLKLATARLILEESVGGHLAIEDEAIRQRDIAAALTPSAPAPHKEQNPHLSYLSMDQISQEPTHVQLREVVSVIESIRPDPSDPGLWHLNLTGHGVDIPVAAAEAKALREGVVHQIGDYAYKLYGALIEARIAYQDRVDKAEEHPIVHHLVRWTADVDDLDPKKMARRYADATRIRDWVLDDLKAGKLTHAVDRAFGLEFVVDLYAKSIGEWNDELLGGAGRWVLALTILKDGLTALATFGTAGVTADLVTGGMSTLRATVTVVGAGTAAGGLGAGGASLVGQAASGKGLSASETFGAVRVGAGTGFAATAAPGAAKGAQQLFRVGGAATTAGNLGRTVLAETVSSTGVNVTAAGISGGSISKAALGSVVTAPLGSLGNAGVRSIAKGSGVATIVGSGLVGSGSAATGAAVTGATKEEIFVAAAGGGAGGTVGAALHHYGSPPPPGSSPPGSSGSTPEGSTITDSTVTRGTSGSTVSMVDPYASTAVDPLGPTRPESHTAVDPGPPTEIDPANQFRAGPGSEPGRLGPVVEHIDPTQWVHPIQQIRGGANGINVKYLLVDATTGERWLFKPASEEEGMAVGPDLGIRRGERWRRAAAAAYLSEDMGMETPYTRLIEMGNEVGSLQEWRNRFETGSSIGRNPARRNEFEDFWNSQARRDIDAFDWFIAQQDRHFGNFMMRMENGRPRLLLIDQDASIPPSDQRFSRNLPAADLRHYQRELPPTVSEEVADRFRALAEHFPEATLRQWLTGPEVDGLWSRLNQIVDRLNAPVGAPGRIMVVP